MRIIRGHEEAQWLPSRFHFATGRLIAWFMYRRAKRREKPSLVLAIDGHQNNFESVIVSIAVLAASTCYAGVLFARIVHPVVAAALALPIASLVLHLLWGALSAVAILLRVQRPIRMNSIILMTTMIAVSAYFALSEQWVRFVALAFLGGVALNLVAALVAWPLRRRFARLEQQYEVAG